MNRDKSKLKEEDDFDDLLSQYKKTLGYSAKAKKKTYKRNKDRDGAAWIIIYGGTSVAVAAAFALFVAEGLMSRGQARTMQNHLRKTIGYSKGRAWSYYLQTGDIVGAINKLGQ